MIEIELLLSEEQREKIGKAMLTDGWLADIQGNGVRVVLRPTGGTPHAEVRTVEIRLN